VVLGEVVGALAVAAVFITRVAQQWPGKETQVGPQCSVEQAAEVVVLGRLD